MTDAQVLADLTFWLGADPQGLTVAPAQTRDENGLSAPLPNRFIATARQEAEGAPRPSYLADYDEQGRLLRLEAVYWLEQNPQREVVNAPYSYEAFDARLDWEKLGLIPLAVVQPYVRDESSPKAVSFDVPGDCFTLIAQATVDLPGIASGTLITLRWNPVYDALEAFTFYPSVNLRENM